MKLEQTDVDCHPLVGTYIVHGVVIYSHAS